MKWHERKGAGPAIRLLGAILVALAYFAATALRRRALAGPPLDGDALAWLLAAASFLCASCGAAMALLGDHLFDPVMVARRWSRIGGERRAQARGFSRESRFPGCQAADASTDRARHRPASPTSASHRKPNAQPARTSVGQWTPR